jgi:hypothetical protein
MKNRTTGKKSNRNFIARLYRALRQAQGERLAKSRSW